MSSSVRSSAANARDAVVTDGTPSTTIPSASNRPRRKPAYTSPSLVSRIADGIRGAQPCPVWSTPGRSLLKPAACHQRASRTEVSSTSLVPVGGRHGRLEGEQVLGQHPEPLDHVEVGLGDPEPQIPPACRLPAPMK